MENKTKGFRSFDDFMNLYEVQKTLRFELKAVPETEAVLKNKGIWYAEDEKKAKEKPVIKFYMDILHREFAQEALQNVFLDLRRFFTLFDALKQAQKRAAPTQKDKRLKQEKIKHARKEIRDEIKNLSKSFKNAFDQVDQNWKTKYREAGKKIKNEKSDSYLILSENVLNFLKNRFTQDEIRKLRINDAKHAEQYTDIIDSEEGNIADNFKGFFGYFDSLISNRKNFYKIDGKAARIATRALNENLMFFAENIYALRQYFKDDLLAEMTKNEKNVFQEDFYNSCLLQNGITTYNQLIGDINKKINQYNQQKNTDIPFFKILYKQILSLEDREDYKHVEIKNEDDLLSAIRDFMEINKNKIEFGRRIFKDFLERCRSKQGRSQLYLPKDSANTVTRKIFKPYEDIMGLYENKYFVSLQMLWELMNSNDWRAMAEESEAKNNHIIFKDSVAKNLTLDKRDVFSSFLLILEEEYQKQFAGFEREVRGKKIKIIGYDEALKNLQTKIKWFESQRTQKTKPNESEKTEWIQAVKEYADATLRIFQMTKYFWLPVIGDEDDKNYKKVKAEIEELPTKDQNFYNKIDSYIVGYEPYVYRSSFQEYLTRKPFSKDKFKINFDNSQLLKGWDQNQEINKCAVILKKDNLYYLGIINPEFRNDLFRKSAGKSTTQKIEEAYKITKDEDRYLKMEYKAIADASKDVQGLLLSRATEENLQKFKPSDHILKIKEKETYKKGEDFNSGDMMAYIDYFKSAIPRYENWNDYKFILSDTKNYKSFDEFTDEIDYYGYDIWFEDVSRNYIKRKAAAGELFLFEIRNRDFSKKSKGHANLHTSYFRYLFSDQNDPRTNDGRIRYRLRLGANAEIFYRKTSIEDREQIITQANKISLSKKINNPYHFKRYTEDKIFLHLPIRLNADSYKTKRLNISQSTRNFLHKNEIIKVIGIDRGEKNLAYYSVISQNQDGKLKVEDCGDLNLGYLEPLDKLEKDRQEQRKAWQSISAIKSKRDGYISHAIHKIADLILKHKAIVVFEDLSGPFKRSRMKVEKAPYQQLELALIKKLNYLVDKKISEGKAGHYLSAYQLADQIGSYKDMGKQTGIIFYTEAGYTSRTCPRCGWRKRIQGLRYKNLDSAKKLFDPKKGIQISFDGKHFVFSYPVMYEGKITQERERNVNSDVSRIRWDNAERKHIFYGANEITGKIQDLFTKYGIETEKNINLQIQNIRERDFWERLISTLYLILEIRNTDNESGRDYIECPHCHFHSDKGLQGKEWNGDANGAFNIARKGLMLLDRIRASDEPEKMNWTDMRITMKEWDEATAKWAKQNGVE